MPTITPLPTHQKKAFWTRREKWEEKMKLNCWENSHWRFLGRKALNTSLQVQSLQIKHLCFKEETCLWRRVPDGSSVLEQGIVPALSLCSHIQPKSRRGSCETEEAMHQGVNIIYLCIPFRSALTDRVKRQTWWRMHQRMFCTDGSPVEQTDILALGSRDSQAQQGPCWVSLSSEWFRKTSCDEIWQ